MLTMVVPDEAVPKIIESIIRVNQSGRRGDGKIFVSPMEGASRIRTGESGGEAIS